MTGRSQEAAGTPREEATQTEDAAEPEEQPRSAVDATRFAHHSEAEMARILDFYEVRWDYEPTTFPILWNLDGEVVESFAPDFYLPDLELFLEMTTLKQRLVRKKNRKLRRLRELYPDIRIKLFYARDFRAMMLKYGRLGLAESLTGTPGQVIPVRPPSRVEGADAAAVPAGSPDLQVETAIALAATVHGVDVEAEPADLPAPGDPGADVPRAEPRVRGRRRRRRTGHAARAGAPREAKA